MHLPFFIRSLVLQDSKCKSQCIGPDDSMLLMMANSAKMIDDDVKIKLATVNALCTSPPMAVQMIPTRHELSHGTVPEMAMRVVFQPSTNSSACRWSFRRSRNIH